MSLDRAIFLHIPKTAGRTLQSVLNRNLGKENITLFHRYGRSFAQFVEEENLGEKPNRLVMGHMFFGVHRYLPASYHKHYFTFLRAPIHRVISYYNYVKKQYGFHRTGYGHLSLHEYVDMDPSREIERGQVRMLAGAMLKNGAGEVGSFPAYLCRKPDSIIPTDDAELLEMAKNNLKEHFFLAGLTDRFDESLLLLGEYLGFENCKYVKSNVGKTHDAFKDMAPATLELIAEKTKLDRALYYYAEDLLDKKIQERGEPFQEKYAAFKKAIDEG